METPASSRAREIVNIIIRAITWNILLERNARIFNDKYTVSINVIVKCIYMLISWINAAPESKKPRLEEPAPTAKCSLEFLRQPSGSGEERPTTKGVKLFNLFGW